MKLEENIARIVLFIAGLLMVLSSIAFLNAADKGMFLGIFTWLGFIILLISLTLYNVPIITSDNDVEFQIDQTQLRSRLLKGIYLISTVTLCIIQMFYMNFTEFKGYKIGFTNPYIYFAHLLITIIYVKYIRRSVWYGLLGLLGIYSLFIILNLTPKRDEKFEVKP